VDLEYVKQNAPTVMTPIVFTNLKEGQTIKINAKGNVTAKDNNVISIEK
jgi:PTS system D-glucosamine-specific IIC component